MKVLVVDDSATMRRIIIKNLNDAGFSDTVEAENGIEAISRMAGVELVLTDWNMPVMDGLSFVKEIRRNTAYANVPIVMITSIGAKKEVVEALKQGVNNYIVKPFTPAILIEKVKSVIPN
ncbi:MAG: response regulator [Candidatus Zixiibacteriota bacterium]|nr:MAG: response regulator [candidate division Zixibacteria bacterium]